MPKKLDVIKILKDFSDDYPTKKLLKDLVQALLDEEYTTQGEFTIKTRSVKHAVRMLEEVGVILEKYDIYTEISSDDISDTESLVEYNLVIERTKQ